MRLIGADGRQAEATISFGIFIFQRKSKYQEAKLKALKARNEYILCLEASNTTIHKYFVDDLSDLIDVSRLSAHAHARASH
jgi:hypothetical protein